MSDDPVSAEEVAHRRFSYSFRGFDPAEVREYLDRVAEELRTSVKRERDLQRRLADAEHRAAHPVVDESVLTRTLGEETSRVLASAHDVARELRAKAEENAARILRDAHAEAQRIRASAEVVLAERTEEADTAAEGIRQAAVSEVDSSLQQAREEASAIVAEAESQAARMMKEAEASSARVLSELGRRRRTAQAQIEQLRAGRERLLEAYRVVRRTLEEVVDELQRSEPEARLAAGAATRRPAGEIGRTDEAGGPEEDVIDLDAPVSASVAATPARSVAARARPDEASAEEDASPPTDLVGGVELSPPEDVPTPAPDVQDEAVLEARPDPEAPPVSPLDIPAEPRAETAVPAEPEPVGTEPVEPASAAPTEPPAVDPSWPRTQTEPVPEAAQVVEAPQTAGRVEEGEAVPQPTVSELFARLKADRAAAVARARQVLGGEEDTEEPAGPSTPFDQGPEPAVGEGAVSNGDEAFLQRRDAALEDVVSGLARRLKRALQDDQNDVLDRLRSHRGRPPAELLPSVDDQAERYRGAGMQLLEEAAVAGADFVAPGGAHQVDIGDLADGLAESLLGPLRRRLERAMSGEQGEDPSALVERVGAAYREWKSQRVDRLAGDAAVSAFSRGTAAAAPGATLRWVVDDDGGPCPDCHDNALAGPTPSGQAYPTGQQHPPAHAGCRCLLVPASP
ncbi:MAG: DivIVA domain-containing protein [Actinomycetota bacterium]|nr:DivIVA domain-containing protein [Actinomycetota bacterium]